MTTNFKQTVVGLIPGDLKVKTYKPIGEILEELEPESKDIDKELKNIFQNLGY